MGVLFYFFDVIIGFLCFIIEFVDDLFERVCSMFKCFDVMMCFFYVVGFNGKVEFGNVGYVWFFGFGFWSVVRYV